MTRTPPDAAVEPFYPDTDGQPMAESDPTRDYLIYAVASLRRHFASRDDVYVSGNLFIYYERGLPDAVIAPDVFVVFGVANRQRRSYKVWEENGVVPAFVLEITSFSTHYTDRVEKRRKYADLGVREYFQFDPTGDYLDPPLQGLQLVAGEYEPLAVGGNGDGTISLASAVLGLELRLAGGELRFYNPATGERLRNYDEAEAERQAAEAARQAAETARLEAEAERQAAIANLYEAAARLLASGMTLEQVAAIVNLPVEELRQRFEQ